MTRSHTQHRLPRIKAWIEAAVRKDRVLEGVLTPLCPAPYTAEEVDRAIVQCIFADRACLAQEWWEKAPKGMNPCASWAADVFIGVHARPNRSGKQWVAWLAWLDKHGLLHHDPQPWGLSPTCKTTVRPHRPFSMASSKG